MLNYSLAGIYFQVDYEPKLTFIQQNRLENIILENLDPPPRQLGGVPLSEFRNLTSDLV